MKMLVATVMGVLSGGMLSQFPEYVQQYQQRVGGAVDELSEIVERFDADADEFGLSRDEALQRYLNNDDEFIELRGKSMSEIISRYNRLKTHYYDLVNAAPFERLWIFTRERDNEIAANTRTDYQPAIPFTGEGAAHAGAGFVGGFGLTSLVLAPFGGRRRRKRNA